MDGNGEALQSLPIQYLKNNQNVSHLRAFLIHVPCAVICLSIISLTLPTDKPPSYVNAGSTYGIIENCKVHAEFQSNSFDIVGLTLLTIVITCLLSVVQLTEAQDLKNKSIILIVCLGAFLTCSVAFYLNETRWARNPMIPFYLLKTNKLGLVYGAQIFIGLGQLGVSYITFACADGQQLTNTLFCR